MTPAFPGCNGYGVDGLGNCARLNTNLFDLVVTADAYGKDINGNPGRAAFIDALSTDARCVLRHFRIISRVLPCCKKKKRKKKEKKLLF
jgi:hypothetical protein